LAHWSSLQRSFLHVLALKVLLARRVLPAPLALPALKAPLVNQQWLPI
jgi:hypothetical protein